MNLDYFYLSRNLQKKVDGVAERLASGLNGRLERGGFWKGMPKIYTKKDMPIQITFFKGGGRVPLLFTRFTLQRTSQGSFYMRIYDKGILSRIAIKLGMRSIEIGDPEFDDLFVVKSNDAALAKRLVDPKTRHSIKMLYQNRNNTIDNMITVPDSLRREAEDKSFAGAMKVINLISTPSCPTFEIRLDKMGLCLEIYGLINQSEKAELLLDELMTIYSDWHLFRV